MLFGLFGKPQDINLIPEEEQKLKAVRIRFIILGVIAVVIIAELLVFFFVTLIAQGEKGSNNKLQKEVSLKNTEWQKIASPAAQVKVIKTKLSTYQLFDDQHPSIPLLIGKLQKVMPTGIELTSLSITNLGKVSIQAKASKPSIIYQFFSVLQETEDFDSIELEGIGKQGTGGYNFILSLTVK